jgi:protein tyrosine phosphatase (PTP) superfamily phosphohydrolase (DUF442 family)
MFIFNRIYVVVFILGFGFLRCFAMDGCAVELPADAIINTAASSEVQNFLKREIDFYWASMKFPEDLGEEANPAVRVVCDKNFIAGMAMPRKIEHIRALHNLGIRFIVTLTPEPIGELFENKISSDALKALFSDMTFVHIPVYDDGLPKPSIEHLKIFLNTIDLAMSRYQRVAVHCQHGIVRTGFFISSWYLVECGFTARQVFSIFCRPMGRMIPFPSADDVSALREFSYMKRRASAAV